MVFWQSDYCSDTYCENQTQSHILKRHNKPANIFFSGRSLKVGDFGLVKETGLKPNPVGSGSQDSNFEHTPGCGTYLYQSIEQMDDSGNYNNKVDIFALGVIWVELHSVFDTESERCQVLAKLKKVELPDTLASFESRFPKGFQLLQNMLAQDPILRPTASAILEVLDNELSSVN